MNSQVVLEFAHVTESSILPWFVSMLLLVPYAVHSIQ